MILGFTGTRHGLTQAQRATLIALLRALKPSAVHHGCCIGADATFALASSCLDPKPHIVGWPQGTLSPSLTSGDALHVCDEVMDAQAPLMRNRCIIACCERLIACPEGWNEQQRSGTWMTVRLARKVGKPITIIYPDGSTHEE